MKLKYKILVFNQLYSIVVFVIFSTCSLFSQSITTPVLGTTPGGVGDGYIICADDTNFLIPFSYTKAGVFNSGNTFTIEMSDASGSFTTITAQTTSNTSPINITIPTNLVGGNSYKFRIKSSNPVVYSPITPVFEIHYKLVKDIEINNNLPSVVICGAFGITLSITNPFALPPNLKYKWFKNSTLLPGEIGSSITFTAPGNYQAEIDYGICSILPNPAVLSNIVSVTSNTSGGNYIITSSNGNVVSAGVPTTLSVPQNGGNSYKWYKDGLLMVGETNYNLITDVPGLYELEVNDGSCISRTNSIKLIDIKDPGNITSKVIPNMISPNGDGENDNWEIPQEFLGESAIVTIIDSNGKTVLNPSHYDNLWPQNNIDFDSINPIYYYIITPINGVVLKGTITIVK